MYINQTNLLNFIYQPMHFYIQ